jgi:lysophospholipase L1-like esterase
LTRILFALIVPLCVSGREARIVTFGDSLTAPRSGVITYSDVLARSLPEEGIKAEVSNSGVPGNTTTQARARFASDVLAKSPHLVIIQFGANDSAVDVWKDPPANKPRVPIDNFRDNLLFFIRVLRERDSKEILMTPNRFAWTPRLRGLYGKPPYDVTSDDGFNIIMDIYSGVVREIARREKIDLIDAAQAVPSSALLDGMHPGTEGHRIIADLLLPVVQTLLGTP